MKTILLFLALFFAGKGLTAQSQLKINPESKRYSLNYKQVKQGQNDSLFIKTAKTFFEQKNYKQKPLKEIPGKLLAIPFYFQATGKMHKMETNIPILTTVIIKINGNQYQIIFKNFFVSLNSTGTAQEIPLATYLNNKLPATMGKRTFQNFKESLIQSIETRLNKTIKELENQINN